MTTTATKYILRTMRAIASLCPQADATHEVNYYVGRSRAYGRTRYFLEYAHATLVGCDVVIDVTRKSAWVRPIEVYAERGISEYVRDRWLTVAKETLLMDALFEGLHNAGYTLQEYSATQETLDNYRTARA